MNVELMATEPMNTEPMTTSSWQAGSVSQLTVTRSASVVPVFGFGMGDVCLNAAGSMTGTSTLKRHADAIKAYPVAGRPPWSPPVT